MFAVVKDGYTHKGAKPVKTYPTQEVLAVACAAQRINGAYIKDTRRFSWDACQEIRELHIYLYKRRFQTLLVINSNIQKY